MCSINIDLVLCLQVMAGNPRRPPSSWCVTSLGYCCLIASAVTLAVLQVAEPGSCLHAVCQTYCENNLPNGTVNQQVLGIYSLVDLSLACSRCGSCKSCCAEAKILQSLNSNVLACNSVTSAILDSESCMHFHTHITSC